MLYASSELSKILDHRLLVAESAKEMFHEKSFMMMSLKCSLRCFKSFKISIVSFVGTLDKLDKLNKSNDK